MNSSFPLEPAQTCELAVIGAGPAGLMAAEAALAAGLRQVHVFDAMPSAGRKFLLAGKGGLNLTHSEALPDFLTRYGESAPVLTPLLRGFGPDALRAWAQDLGVATFVGTSGRVFPADMKAAPLLRAWLQRLRAAGLQLHMRQRWLGWAEPPQPGQPQLLRLQTPAGLRLVRARAVVLALGGGSWARLGSDGAWTALLQERGIHIAPLLPANCGFQVLAAPAPVGETRREFLRELPGACRTWSVESVLEERRSQKWAAAVDLQPTIAKSGRLLGRAEPPQPGWSAYFAERFAGQPFKSVALSFRDSQGRSFARRGEFVATARGIEGSLVYAAAHLLRDEIAAQGHATLHLDLLPDHSSERVLAEVCHPRGARSLPSHLKSRLGLGGIKTALLHEVLGKEGMQDAASLARAIKALPITLVAPSPIDESISSAGGVRWQELDEALMLRALPGLFCAGEMLDWEAPTGGYLLTACFASGRAAGFGAARWLEC